MTFASKTLSKPIFLSKSIFLIVYAAASVLLPFLALYYEERGLSGAQMGILAGIPPVMTMIGDPYVALSLQLLNGLAFGALLMAGVAYAKEIAPKGMGATAQGLLSGVYFGFSSAVGALLGGIWYEQLGSWGMYRWGAVVMLIGLVIFVLAGSVRVRSTAKQPVKLSS